MDFPPPPDVQGRKLPFMQINYLILAHSNFEHLQRLIDSLESDGVNFFIHIDKKSKSLPKIRQNVIFTPKRYNIGWGNFNMVLATLELLKMASTVSGQGRYILLSGVDYPIRSNADIRHIMDQPYQFIDINPTPSSDKPSNRFDNFFFNIDRKKKSLVNSALKRIEGILNDRLKFRRKLAFPLYAGSQWFALTHDCVHYILAVARTQKYGFFKYTLIPDESFFQTIVGNSPFKSLCKPHLTYCDWTTVPAPARISMKHIELLETDTDRGCFARKFDDQSTQETQEIDRILRKYPE